ncbi:MAG TPA: hypothetical protein VFZ67_03255 [Nitrososphaera sp.]
MTQSISHTANGFIVCTSEARERDSRVATKVASTQMAVRLFNLHSKIVHGVEKEETLEQLWKRE